MTRITKKPEKAQKVIVSAEEVSQEEVPQEEVPQEGYHTNHSAPPYLPAHLLRPFSPVGAISEAVSIPWEEMTSKPKRSQGRTSRQQKERAYERLEADAKATGVLQAGRAAQAKRVIVPTSNRVRKGRVQKKVAAPKVRMSGRQKLIEGRKRQVTAAGLPSAARTGSRRRRPGGE